MAQLVGASSYNQKVACLIPSQDTYPGCRSRPSLGTYNAWSRYLCESTNGCFSLALMLLSLSPLLSLSRSNEKMSSGEDKKKKRMREIWGFIFNKKIYILRTYFFMIKTNVLISTPENVWVIFLFIRNDQFFMQILIKTWRERYAPIQFHLLTWWRHVLEYKGEQDSSYFLREDARSLCVDLFSLKAYYISAYKDWRQYRIEE